MACEKRFRMWSLVFHCYTNITTWVSVLRKGPTSKPKYRGCTSALPCCVGRLESRSAGNEKEIAQASTPDPRDMNCRYGEMGARRCETGMVEASLGALIL